MHYTSDFDGLKKAGLGSALGLVRRLDVSALDVVVFDIENLGNAPLTDLRIFASSMPSAPMREITPSNWTLASSLLWQAASSNPTNLSPAQSMRFALNVSAIYQVEVHASGQGAVLAVAAGGYKVQA